MGMELGKFRLEKWSAGKEDLGAGVDCVHTKLF